MTPARHFWPTLHRAQPPLFEARPSKPVPDWPGRKDPDDGPDDDAVRDGDERDGQQEDEL